MKLQHCSRSRKRQFLLRTLEKKPPRLGLIVGIGKNPGAALVQVRELGLPTCQIYVSEIESSSGAEFSKALVNNRLEATSFVVGAPGRESTIFIKARKRSVWFRATPVKRALRT
jgi:hypothetical protein